MVFINTEKKIYCFTVTVLRYRKFQTNYVYIKYRLKNSDSYLMIERLLWSTLSSLLLVGRNVPKASCMVSITTGIVSKMFTLYVVIQIPLPSSFVRTGATLQWFDLQVYGIIMHWHTSFRKILEGATRVLACFFSVLRHCYNIPNFPNTRLRWYYDIRTSNLLWKKYLF